MIFIGKNLLNSASSMLTAAFFLLTTLAGAGFASGRELLEFFLSQEIYGLFSIVVAAVGFSLICRRALWTAAHYDAADIFTLLHELLPARLAAAASVLLSLFLACMAALMLAAVKTALLCWLLPKAAAILTILLALLAALIILCGRRAFIIVTALTAPLLLLSLGCAISLSLYTHLVVLDELVLLRPSSELSLLNCLSDGLLYCFYNSAGLLTALIPLSTQCRLRPLSYGINGGLLLFALLAAALFITLLLHRPASNDCPLPLLAICTAQPPLMFGCCLLSLTAAAWSSYLSSLYNIHCYMQRLLPRPIAMTLLLSLSLLGSLNEYSQLLRLLAPLLSLGGVLIALLFYKKIP